VAFKANKAVFSRDALRFIYCLSPEGKDRVLNAFYEWFEVAGEEGGEAPLNVPESLSGNLEREAYKAIVSSVSDGLERYWEQAKTNRENGKKHKPAGSQPEASRKPEEANINQSNQSKEKNLSLLSKEKIKEIAKGRLPETEIERLYQRYEGQEVLNPVGLVETWIKTYEETKREERPWNFVY